jgi:hypothetical protein
MDFSEETSTKHPLCKQFASTELQPAKLKRVSKYKQCDTSRTMVCTSPSRSRTSRTSRFFILCNCSSDGYNTEIYIAEASSDPAFMN